jgi:5-methylcytosine-specific restriction endonuclease McrBC regulatory subunit McrC
LVTFDKRTFSTNVDPFSNENLLDQLIALTKTDLKSSSSLQLKQVSYIELIVTRIEVILYFKIDLPLALKVGSSF